VRPCRHWLQAQWLRQYSCSAVLHAEVVRLQRQLAESHNQLAEMNFLKQQNQELKLLLEEAETESRQYAAHRRQSWKLVQPSGGAKDLAVQTENEYADDLMLALEVGAACLNSS
jgi:hypothetical protein